MIVMMVVIYSATKAAKQRTHAETLNLSDSLKTSLQTKTLNTQELSYLPNKPTIKVMQTLALIRQQLSNLRSLICPLLQISEEEEVIVLQDLVSGSYTIACKSKHSL